MSKVLCLTALFLLGTASGSIAIAADPADIQLGTETTSRWRFGIVVKAPAAGSITGIMASYPVPIDWPEQQVKVVSEKVSPLVAKVSYRVLDDGVKQMLVSIPRLRAGEEASAIVEYEITKRAILPPESPAGLTAPEPGRDTRNFFRPSPYIESTDPQIEKLAPDTIAGKTEPWEQAEAIYSWVRENVKYEFSPDIKPATTALKAGKGDCEELTSLFIAFCRANKIPARAVWVPDHCYPEFLLQDAKGIGHWYPCQAAGANHDFGRMDEKRPILQKGDNFKVPEERTPQRYVKQFLKAANATADPDVKFILERVKQ